MRGVRLFFQLLSVDSAVNVDVDIVDIACSEVLCTPLYQYFISIDCRGIEDKYTVSPKEALL